MYKAATKRRQYTLLTVILYSDAPWIENNSDGSITIKHWKMCELIRCNYKELKSMLQFLKEYGYIVKLSTARGSSRFTPVAPVRRFLAPRSVESLEGVLGCPPSE